jgi:hypothetical protein
MSKIHGPIQNQDGSWRIRINEEIDLLTKDAHVVRRITVQRIRWVWRIVRIDEERTVRRIREWRRSAVRRIGRPRYR